MIITALTLENIRSYTKAAIAFPEGRILLSGDVGSGKTTILLAIEFALFGILRGELSAASLLRHGESEGRVALSFSIDDQEFEVVRSLKRDSKSVKQGNGSLNGVSLTPVELKARILTILGYSQDLLTKAKSLVFRYTVYTPQEEMKRILFEDPDERLETLRRVFGIDQYKQVQQNTNVLLRELRAEERAHKLQWEELPHKEQELKLAGEILKKQQQEQERITEEKAKQLAAFKGAEERHLMLKKRAEAFQQAKQEQGVLLAQITQLERRQEQLLAAKVDDAKEIAALQVKEEEDLTSLKDRLEKKEEQAVLVDERLLKARQRQASLRANQEQVTQAKERLAGLASTCPLCQQAVPHEHKDALLEEQSLTLAKMNEQFDSIGEFIEKATEKSALLKDQLRQLRAQVLQASRHEERLKNRREQQERTLKELSVVHDDIIKRKERSRQLQGSLKELEQEFTAFERQYLLLNDEREKLNNIKIREASCLATIAAATQQLAALEKALDRLRRHRRRGEVLQRHNYWLKESFLPLTDTIEKTVFGSLHQEFNTLFSNWFDQIIEDDSLRVRLDEEFSPIIDMNGYETEMQALSGGEKTAVALAYRLSLNQVINEFLSTINTRDLLILDEPTDGFSSHQLDRMREVLDQLKVRQLLIVSHEQQVEGFVEQVMRVRKEAHESVVEQ